MASSSSFLPNLDTSAYVLFKIFLRLKAVYSGGYDDLVSKLITYIGRAPNGGPIDVKLTTIFGNSDPSKAGGEADRFLQTFFSGMDMSSRKAYFKQEYVGTDETFDALADNIERAGDNLRLRLKVNDRFVIIALTNKKHGQFDDLFHITLSRDSNYNIAGQHGVPSKMGPVLQSIHFTDEGKSASRSGPSHYVFTYDIEPLNEDAENLNLHDRLFPPHPSSSRYSNTTENPPSSNTKEEPSSSNTKENPPSSNTKEEPSSSNTKEEPSSSNTKEEPHSSSSRSTNVTPDYKQYTKQEYIKKLIDELKPKKTEQFKEITAKVNALGDVFKYAGGRRKTRRRKRRNMLTRRRR